MYPNALRLLVMSLCLTGSAQASAQDWRSVEVSIVPLRVELNPETRLGKKGSGALCGPSGSWRWRDIELIQDRLMMRLEDRFSRAGYRVRPSVADDFGERQPLADIRIRPRVSALKMRGCRNWSPLTPFGEKREIRGEGAIDVTWEVYSVAEGKIIAAHRVEHPFTFTGAPTMRDAFEQGLIEALEPLLSKAGS